MSWSLRARCAALLAAASLVLAGFVPSIAAVADEPGAEPTAEATAEPTAAPTAEPTAEPTDAPTAEPTTAPDPEPTAEPSAPEPVPSATPEVEPSAVPDATAATYTIAGSFTRLSSEDRVIGDGQEHEHDDDGTAVLTVPGAGFLRADVSQLDGPLTAGTVTVRFAVPAGLVVPDDEAEAFAALSTYSTTTAPLIAQSVMAARGVAQRAVPVVNQTPNTPAVHEIFAVLVSPSNGAKGADQTAAKVATSVANTNNYWSQQSSGSVQFHLAGTTTWYTSASSCATDAGSTALWNQAASIAATQLGYVAARNVHLVLFFPGTTNCGGAVGLGTVGWSANEGGAAWVIGTDSAMSQGILSHELGHNISLGHAQWTHCLYDGPPWGDISSCATREYGDVTDVMGYSQFGRTGGALSSPGAIRAGLWPTSAYVDAPVGVTDYTLNSVSSNTGLRSVILVDPNLGDRFFVEFRDLTGEDAPYAGMGCSSDPSAETCAISAPGIRVLRMGGNDYGFVAFPGEDTLLLSSYRCCSGQDKVSYGAGEGFRIGGVPPIGAPPSLTVQVLSISGGTATIRVTRPALHDSTPTVHDDFVSIVPTLTYDTRLRIGDTWTAMLGSLWSAESYAFQWKRNGVSIPGATDPNYTIAAADLGAFLSVSVTGSSPGAAPRTVVDPPSGGWGPVTTGVYGPELPGTVAIDNSATPLQAAPAGWPAGTGFAYQWFRGASASTATTLIPGATSAGYVPTALDAAQFIRVRITATPPGFGPVIRFSPAANFTLAVSGGSLTVAGPLVVGGQLSVADGLTYSALGSAVQPAQRSYQWLRNGSVVVGSGSEYTPVVADFGQRLSVRVTASAPGYVQATTTSTATAAIGKGTLSGTFAPPVVDRNPATRVLTASLPAGSVATGDVVLSYQWIRGAVAVAGATLQSYPLSSADYGQLVSVRVTVSKTNYTSLTLASTPLGYSVASVQSPTITGELRVGEAVTVADREYTAGGEPAAAIQTVQWYRSGVAIAAPLGTAATYRPGAADLGATLTAKVTASVTGFLPSIATSAPTQPVGASSLVGWNAQDAAEVALAPLTNTLTVVGTGITGPAPLVVSYQWYRGTVAVVGATKAGYALSAADYGQAVWVRVTTARAGFTTIVKESARVDYSITGTAPVISSGTGAFRVGAALSAESAGFASKDGALSPSLAYQWMRNGTAIAGATGAGYTPVAADLSARLTVRVTASTPGYLSRVATSAPSVPLTSGVLEGSFALPSVVASGSGMLTATLPGGAVSTATPTVTWQWLRGGVPVPGATAATFALSAADHGKTVSVVATVSKAAYASRTLASSPLDYSVRPATTGALPALSGPGAPKVGATLTVTLPEYATSAGPATVIASYQWLRNGVAIAGATAAAYVVQSGDFGTTLTARVTAAVPGYVASVSVTPTLGPVARGQLLATDLSPLVTASATGILSVAVQPGTLSQPSVTLAYQWRRNEVAVTGATAATYALGAADAGKRISVVVTASKLNTDPAKVLLTSAGFDYSLRFADPAFFSVVQGPAAVSETLGVSIPEYSYRDAPVAPTISYQWVRGSVAIAGATAPTYVVQPADFGAKLLVRLTATSPGSIPLVTFSAATPPVAAGEIRGFGDPMVTTSATGKLTASVPREAQATPGVSYAYQWFRGTTAITGATTSTFQLSALDASRPISVRVTISKPSSTPVPPRQSAGIDYTLARSGEPAVAGAAQVGRQLSVVLPGYTANGAPVIPAVTWVWLRNGIAIPGATAATYLVQPADFAARLSVRATASSPGYLATVATSVATDPVIEGVLENFGTPVVTANATARLSVTVPTDASTTPGSTYSYQWFREGALIAGATASTFALGTADYGKRVAVCVTISKLRSGSPLVLCSEPVDYSVAKNGAYEISGAARVGELLSVALPGYSTAAGAASPAVSYQWMRGAVAIVGATTATYRLQAADLGAAITVRVTAALAGYISSIASSVPTPLVTKGTLDVGAEPPVVQASGSGVLTASLPTVVSVGTTSTFQWLRSGVPIVGATTAKYQLVASDAGKPISVRITVSKAGMVPESIPLTSTAVDWSLQSAPPLVDGATVVGARLTAAPQPYTANGSSVSPLFAYQWLRAGVAIPGATLQYFDTTLADLGKVITVRVTATLPGYLPLALASAVRPAVQAGTFSGAAAPVVSGPPAGVLTAGLVPGDITQTGLTLAYQWLRNGVAIAGATASTYALASADYATLTSVRVTVSRAGYVTLVLPESYRADYSIHATGELLLDAAGSTVSAASVPEYTLGAEPWTPDASNLGYQWYLDGVAVTGAAGRGPTYTVLAPNLGKQLTLRVTVTSAGYLPVSTVSAPVLLAPPAP